MPESDPALLRRRSGGGDEDKEWWLTFLGRRVNKPRECGIIRSYCPAYGG